MRVIDVDKLIDDLNDWVSKIKSVRTDGECFFTQENVLELINKQEIIPVIKLDGIRKRKSNFDFEEMEDS